MSAKPEKSRTRLTPADREKEIVAGAIAFFAENGFDGQTRELAASIGISQALIYRYFPTKEHLIDRVYAEVFGTRWKLDLAALKDRGQPIDARLIRFYTGYAELILGEAYTRLLLFAALNRIDFHKRLFNRIGAEIYPHVIDELRNHFDEPTIEKRPPTPDEIEAVWGLHAAIFFVGIREHVFGLDVPGSADTVALRVRLFLDGVAPAMRPAGAGRGVARRRTLQT